MHKETIEAQAVLQEFKAYWRQNGKPHQGSAAYIALNRHFFYLKGLEQGIMIRTSKKRK